MIGPEEVDVGEEEEDEQKCDDEEGLSFFLPVTTRLERP